MHHDSGFGTAGGSHEVTPKQEIRMDLDSLRGANAIPFPIKTFPTGVPVAAAQSIDK